RGSFNSKEDHVQQISTSIFITSFLKKFSFRDLWTVCQDHGKVIDVFIPNRRSKSGNRFGFARLIKIDDVDRLKAASGEYSRANVNNVQPNSCVFAVKQGSWFSTLQQSSNSLLIDEMVTWIDIKGVPPNVWTKNTFVKISSKWGEFLYDEDKENLCLNSKRICIKTTLKENIFESFKIIVRGRVHWVRAKEISSWVPDFIKDNEKDIQSDNEIIDEWSNEKSG
nr:UvrD-like helicase, ATP-binding domain, P-loop containing nucleoside triphosphate hydrolase [Tanacetum cinerariifolium]